MSSFRFAKKNLKSLRFAASTNSSFVPQDAFDLEMRCTDHLAVRYYQFIDAGVLCGNVSFCVVTLSGVLMLTVMNLCYCFRESYFPVDSTFQQRHV